MHVFGLHRLVCPFPTPCSLVCPDLPFTPLCSLRPEVPAATSMPTRQSRRPSTSHRTRHTPYHIGLGNPAGFHGRGYISDPHEYPHLPHPIRCTSLSGAASPTSCRCTPLRFVSTPTINSRASRGLCDVEPIDKPPVSRHWWRRDKSASVSLSLSFSFSSTPFADNGDEWHGLPRSKTIASAHRFEFAYRFFHSDRWPFWRLTN